MIKNKNLKSFAGSSLLEIKINQLKRIKDIDEIIVSSDSELMMSVAKKKNVKSMSFISMEIILTLLGL